MNQIAKTATSDSRTEFSAFDRFLRRRLVAQMAQLRHGRLVLRDALGTVELGEPAGTNCDLDIRIEVHHPGFYRAVAANGSVGAGESYMDAQWSCDAHGSAVLRCAPGTHCVATPAPAAVAISLRITIWATRFSNCSFRRT